MSILRGLWGYWAARWERFKWPNGVGQGYSRGYMLLVPRFVRRSGGGWGSWLSYTFDRNRAKYWLRNTGQYLDNCRMDFLARRAGVCSEFLTGSGYSYWRCARRAGHRMPHRFNNYTWLGRGPVAYDPIKITHAGHEHWDGRNPSTDMRHNTRNLRQWWVWRGEMKEARARIKR